jgi:uncharacterized protein (DUF1501 family)
MFISRRQLLQSIPAAALLASGLTPRAARALSSGGMRFLFVYVPGGWDPLCVYAPLFSSQSVDMELGAAVSTIGNIPIVDHPARPSVRAFFERWHQRTVVLNGVSVRSVSHEICQQLMLTGTSSGSSADWATRISAAKRDQFTLPHLVLNGPSFAGADGTAVARSGAAGQLNGLLNGSLVTSADKSPGRLSPAAESVLDRYLARRALSRQSSAATGTDAQLSKSFAESHDRARGLKGMRLEVNFDPGSTLETQLRTAVSALTRNLSRCVTVQHPGYWDTHQQNNQQSPLFDNLFHDLDTLQTLLASTPSPSGGKLADDTMVVVLSEMGRTPKLNGASGRDHWPYTSVLLTGPRLVANRVIGQFDKRYYGLGVDPTSAETGETAPPLNVEALGATLLSMADVDPGEHNFGAKPLTGLFK